MGGRKGEVERSPRLASPRVCRDLGPLRAPRRSLPTPAPVPGFYRAPSGPQPGSVRTAKGLDRVQGYCTPPRGGPGRTRSPRLPVGVVATGCIVFEGSQIRQSDRTGSHFSVTKRWPMLKDTGSHIRRGAERCPVPYTLSYGGGRQLRAPMRSYALAPCHDALPQTPRGEL